MTSNTNINDIVARARQPFAKTNRYLVEINLPVGAFGIADSAIDVSIDDFINRAQFSGTTNQVIDNVRQFINIPNARDFINLGLNSAGISTMNISMMCETAQLPGMVLSQTEQRTYGPSKRRPNNSVFLEMPLGFYSSEDHRERLFFDLWFSVIMNRETHDLNFYDEYKADIFISQLDSKGRPTYKVKLIDAFPLNMTAIELGYANFSQIARFTVSFSYHEWKPIVIDLTDGINENVNRVTSAAQILT